MKNKIVAMLTGFAVLLSPIQARAYQITGTVTSVATTGGVVWLVWWLIDSNSKKSRTADDNSDREERESVQVQIDEKSAKEAAAYFLKENSVGLARDLATGEGAVLNMLAAGLQIPVSHRAQLGRVVQAHQAELSELARADRMTPDRAGQFVERFLEIANSDVTIAADLQQFASAQSMN